MCLLILLLILVVIIAAAYYYYRPASAGTKGRGEGTLYDRLGGLFSIAAVVDRFSDRLIDNPIVGKDSANPMLQDWHRNKLGRLPGLKFMRTLWLASLSGGPFKYTPVRAGKCPFSLEKAHDGLHISSAEFDAVAGELSATLDEFKVPEAEKAEVLAAFAAHKSEVLGQEPAKC